MILETVLRERCKYLNHWRMKFTTSSYCSEFTDNLDGHIGYADITTF